MKNRFALMCVLFLLLSAALSIAGGNDLVVMSVKGKAEYLKGGKGKPIPMTIGLVLSPGDIVKTSFASYAKLMYKQRYLLSVDENSTVRVRTLLAQTGNEGEEKSSTTGKILGFVAEKLKKSRDEEKETIYGAVRGGRQDMLNAVFPRKGYVEDTHPVFEWLNAGDSPRCTFSLADEDLKTVYETATDSTRLPYDASFPPLREGKRYLWRVTRESDGAASDIASFTVMRRDTAEQVRAEIAGLDAELRKMKADDVTAHIVRATYYEQRELFREAFREYRSALALAPAAKEYRTMALVLLFRMGLYNEHLLLLP